MRPAVAAALLISTFACAGPNVRAERFPLDGELVVSRLASGMHMTEGPTWVPRENALLFSDLDFDRHCWLYGEPCGAIYRVAAPAGVQLVRQPSYNSNGMALDREGKLLVAEGTTRRVTRTEPDGRIAVLAERFGRRRLNGPNDLVVHSDGSIYFTDPDFATREGDRELGFDGVFRIDARGEVQLVSRSLSGPNGIALSRDERTLYVTDEREGVIVAFALGADGLATGERIFARHLSYADGMTVDARDNLYVATAGGVAVFAPDGEHLATLAVRDPVTGRAVHPTNCTLGGPAGDVLFVTADDAVYRVERRPAH